MKKLLALVFVVLLLLFVPQISMAKADTQCSTLCHAYTNWIGGSNKGIADVFSAVADNNMNDANGYAQTYIEDDNSDGSVTLEAGIYTGGTNGNGNWCTASGTYYFVNAFYSGSDHATCYAIPSGDLGFNALFKIGFYTSNGGGMFIQIQGHSGFGYCYSGCGFGGLPETYTGTVSIIDEVHGTFSSNVQNHSQWIDNQYDNSTGWHYVHGNPSNVVPQNPPALYWSTYPTDNTTGGVEDECIYNSSQTTC